MEHHHKALQTLLALLIVWMAFACGEKAARAYYAWTDAMQPYESASCGDRA